MILTVGHVLLGVLVFGIVLNFFLGKPEERISRKSPFPPGHQITPLFGTWYEYEKSKKTPEEKDTAVKTDS